MEGTSVKGLSVGQTAVSATLDGRVLGRVRVEVTMGDPVRPEAMDVSIVCANGASRPKDLENCGISKTDGSYLLRLDDPGAERRVTASARFSNGKSKSVTNYRVCRNWS